MKFLVYTLFQTFTWYSEIKILVNTYLLYIVGNYTDILSFKLCDIEIFHSIKKIYKGT